MIQKFRNKSHIIDEAVQWDGKNFDEISQFIDQNHGHKLAHENAEEAAIKTGNYLIITLKGIMFASIGDWVINDINGEFYPCKRDVFDKTYELVSNGL